MPEAITIHKAFTFKYEAANGRLRVQWHGPVTEAILHVQYTQLLAAAKVHGYCRFWLLDLRERNWHAAAFGSWFSEGFASTAQSVLGQPLFMAYIISPRHRASADSLAVQTTQRRCAVHDVYPFFFDSEDAALAWLLHQQAPGH